MRRDVLDQVAAGWGRRNHRADLQGAGDEARLRLRSVGLEDRLSRDDRILKIACVNAGEELMASFARLIRLTVGAAAFLLVISVAGPSGGQQINPTARSVKEQPVPPGTDRIPRSRSIPR